MINLLPPDVQANYRYAHRNARLLRWAVAFGLGILGLAIISTAGLLYLHQTSKNYAAQVETAKSNLQAQDQAKTEKNVKDISSSIRLAVQVLSKEVLFSELLKQIARVTPSNVSFANLSISQIKGALDITANTTDYSAATQLQVNLADPSNKIFSKADIINISCSSGVPASQAKSHYPCSVTIRALFSANNPFLFINNPKAGS